MKIERTEQKLIGVKAAVMDLDGTLFDSTGLWADIDVAFLKKRGFEPTAEYKRGIAALGNREVARFTVRYYGLKDTEDELICEWAEMARDAYKSTVKLLPGAREYLERIRSRGIKILAVTSLARELAEAGLIGNCIYDMFDCIITADETGLSKTAPDIYTYAAARAGAEPSACVAFDDVIEAIRSAKRAGFKTVAVRGEGGYDDGAADGFDAADYVVRDLSFAPELLP